MVVLKICGQNTKGKIQLKISIFQIQIDIRIYISVGFRFLENQIWALTMKFAEYQNKLNPQSQGWSVGKAMISKEWDSINWDEHYWEGSDDTEDTEFLNSNSDELIFIRESNFPYTQ